MGHNSSAALPLVAVATAMPQPSGGKVWLGDSELTGLSEDEKSKLRLHRMGFVFQQMNMMANLNLPECDESAGDSAGG